MAAAFFGAPDLVLDNQESAALAKAIADVSEHYGLATVLDDKTVAWVNLIQTSIAIYGTRFMTMRLKAKIAAEKRADAAAREPQPKAATAPGHSAPAPRPAESASAKIPGLGDIVVQMPTFNPNGQ